MNLLYYKYFEAFPLIYLYILEIYLYIIVCVCAYIQLKSKVYIHLAESANINYFTKIRGIIQNACYCLFSTDLNKIFHIKYVYI